MKRIALVMGLVVVSMIGCGGAQTPVAGPAADNGQPKMQAALSALQAASEPVTDPARVN